MRRIMPVFRVCALALAVLFGFARSSAAEPVGQTGKTAAQCEGDYAACIGSNGEDGSCVDDYGSCLHGGVPVTICHYNLDQCTTACNREYQACMPARIVSKWHGLDQFIISGPVTILAGIDRLSARLDDLAKQVGAALPADLVPLPLTPGSTDPYSFCDLTPDFTTLLVHVSNQGTVGSPASTTHVDFANNPGVDMPTPPLAPGGSAVVQFAVPASCYDASHNCHFTIVVDSTNAVIESNETNNSAAGICNPS
jgi:hypothetical protein